VTRRLAGFLAGVRRTKIEAGRYKAGWMRLSAGGRTGMAGEGDDRGTDDRTADAPPVAFWRGGSLLPPPVDRLGPVYGDGLNGGDKK
jgi:hypothetical protein